MDIVVPVEIRESGRLYATLITEGRSSQDRREIFVPGSISWASEGILVRPEHLKDEGAVRGYPHRSGTEIRLNVSPSPELRSAVQEGRQFMSVEFHALRETTTPSGIREITSALLTGAATVSSPSYGQTSAEIRSAKYLDDFILYL